jgi:cytochrome c peroxidase
MDGLPAGVDIGAAQHESRGRKLMRRHTSRFVTASLAAVFGILTIPQTASAADPFQVDQPFPPYNPYPPLPGSTPPTVLPPDLQPEIYRVRREVQTIFGRYFAEWQALTPPVRSNTQGEGNPPILQGTGYDAVRILGGLLNYDENMSPFRNEACAFCHLPYAGFSGPIPSVNLTMVAYPGSFRYRANKRTAQRYTYSPWFPQLFYNSTQGAFFGGNFWDGRSTGYLLQSPDAEQAQHPPVDTGEMGFPDTACIALRISEAPYRPLFELVWRADFNIRWPGNVEKICSTPGGNFPTAMPIALSSVDRTKADNIYDHWGQSISFLEHSPDVSPFTSKFDFFLKNPTMYPLTADEMAGFQLFNGKGNCNSCHLDGRSTLLSPGQTDTGNTADPHPVFTDFGSGGNLGLPLNPRLPLFYESKPDRFGFTPNPDGFRYRDLLLGNFLRSGPQSAPDPNAANWLQFAPTTDGRGQTPTARNVAMTPPQCPTTEAGQVDAHGNPIPYFQKEFFHNGYAKSLKQLVHFYNTRDVYPYNVTSGHCPPGTIEKVTCWPMPEVPNNVNTTIGSLGLTDQEENLIVIFMQTLTDGFDPNNPTVSTYANIDTFTGQCAITAPGVTASTQGNETLIPTWSLTQFPCATDICGVPPLPGPFPIP